MVVGRGWNTLQVSGASFLEREAGESRCVMVGLLTTREKFDCCVMLWISKEANFSFVNCPQ